MSAVDFPFLHRALAASAPIWQFGDLIPCNRYSQIVTNDFKESGQNCPENIRRSWKVIDDIAKTGNPCQVCMLWHSMLWIVKGNIS